MKPLNPALQAHLDDGTTTLSWCWRITRADGVTFGFTDHDRTLSFDGTEFEPESGLTASEVRSGSDLSVDAQDATRRAVVGPDHRDRHPRRPLGQCGGRGLAGELGRHLRSACCCGAGPSAKSGAGGWPSWPRSGQLAHVLGQTVGRTFQASCDAALGDARCGVNLEAPAFKGSGAVIDVLRDRAFTASGLGWFRGRLVHLRTGRMVDRRRMPGGGSRCCRMTSSTASPS